MNTIDDFAREAMNFRDLSPDQQRGFLRTMPTASGVIEHLRRLHTGERKPQSAQLGICHELSSVCLYPCPIKIQYLCWGWPKHSGDAFYPVKYEGYPSPAMAFTSEDELWADDQYGNDRRELAGYMAERLQALLDQAASETYGALRDE